MNWISKWIDVSGGGLEAKAAPAACVPGAVICRFWSGCWKVQDGVCSQPGNTGLEQS